MKSIFLLLISVHIVFAQVQTVSVGKIDKNYSDLVSKKDLVKIIKEIETLFEKQLGFNVFDYQKVGAKPIDIIYMPPSQKKKRILQNKKKSEALKKKISNLKRTISHKQTLLDLTKNELESQYKKLNREVEELNLYISSKKSSHNLSKYDYESIKQHISRKKSAIRMKKRDLDRKKREFNSKRLSFTNRLSKYNSLIRRYNYYQRDIERLSKNYKEIKGETKKHIKVTTTTSIKDGQAITKHEKEIKSDKIEIYDFENLNILKVILAHEIGHLVGVGHINVKGALMNPNLQKEQVNKLFLTDEDIKAFTKVF